MSEAEPSPHLFDPLRLRGLTLRNRLGVAPMCQYSSDDGFATDWHLVHLGGFAAGGAGLVIAEATAVSPEGRISPNDVGLWKDAHVEVLARVARFVRSQGAAAGIQLAHAGRKAGTRRPWAGGEPILGAGSWTPVAPSALAFDPGHATPAALDEPGITRVIADFCAAARRAREAGFEVVEIHAAHGYLLHEFLSPITNRRTDGWGGPLAHRMRLAIEVARVVRGEWPERLPVFVRISATDWVEGGWDLDQSIALARALADEGVDLVDCSSGGLVPHAKPPFAPGYQVPLSERIRREAPVATAAVGLITEPRQAEAIVHQRRADLVLMAREMLRDPHFPLRAARELGQEAPWPPQYLRARP